MTEMMCHFLEQVSMAQRCRDRVCLNFNQSGIKLALLNLTAKQQLEW